jgi:hypothetical protein
MGQCLSAPDHLYSEHHRAPHLGAHGVGNGRETEERYRAKWGDISGDGYGNPKMIKAHQLTATTVRCVVLTRGLRVGYDLLRRKRRVLRLRVCDAPRSLLFVLHAILFLFCRQMWGSCGTGPTRPIIIWRRLMSMPACGRPPRRGCSRPRGTCNTRVDMTPRHQCVMPLRG